MDTLGGIRGVRWVFHLHSLNNQEANYVTSSALMEYHVCNSKAVAVRIFEKGLEVFADEVEFVLRYLGFLISLNDDQSESFA